MNQLEKTIVTGISGTTLMTAGSALMSKIFKENFSEPEHLETMIARLAPQLSNKAKTIAGWGAHFAMGMVFSAIFVELWQSKKIKCSWRNAVLLGTVSGVVGLFIWKATFKAHPLPPWLNYQKYYLQRIPAHIVFAIGATMAYRLTGPLDGAEYAEPGNV